MSAKVEAGQAILDAIKSGDPEGIVDAIQAAAMVADEEEEKSDKGEDGDEEGAPSSVPALVLGLAKKGK